MEREISGASLILFVPQMFRSSQLRAFNHVGQDWRRKKITFALENACMRDKGMRDTFVDWAGLALERSDAPVAKNFKHQDLMRRKMTCWHHNQHGLTRKHWHTHMPHIDRIWGMGAKAGTREWVPWINLSFWTMHTNIKNGKIFAHRVPYRGYGSDRDARKGKWQHRWNKVLQRNALQYNRI